MERGVVIGGGLNGQSKLTPELAGRIQGLLVSNPRMTLREIARALGDVVSHQTIKSWCQRLKLKLQNGRGKRTRLTPLMETRIRSILAGNPRAYYTDIAEQLDIPTSTVIDWCLNRLHLSKRGSRSLFTAKLVSRLKALRTKRPDATCVELAITLGLPYHCVRDKISQLKKVKPSSYRKGRR